MIDFHVPPQPFDLSVMSVLGGGSSLIAERFAVVTSSFWLWIPLYLAVLYLLIRDNKSWQQIALIVLFSVVAVGVAKGNLFAFVVFFSLLVRNTTFTFTLILWALINCFGTLRLSRDYPCNMMVWSVWGAAMGVACYFLHYFVSRRLGLQAAYVSKKYTSSGYSFGNIYIVSIVFVSLLLFALFLSIFDI